MAREKNSRITAEASQFGDALMDGMGSRSQDALSTLRWLPSKRSLRTKQRSVTEDELDEGRSAPLIVTHEYGSLSVTAKERIKCPPITPLGRSIKEEEIGVKIFTTPDIGRKSKLMAMSQQSSSSVSLTDSFHDDRLVTFDLSPVRPRKEFDGSSGDLEDIHEEKASHVRLTISPMSPHVSPGVGYDVDPYQSLAPASSEEHASPPRKPEFLVVPRGSLKYHSSGEKGVDGQSPSMSSSITSSATRSRKSPQWMTLPGKSKKKKDASKVKVTAGVGEGIHALSRFRNVLLTYFIFASRAMYFFCMCNSSYRDFVNPLTSRNGSSFVFMAYFIIWEWMPTFTLLMLFRKIPKTTALRECTRLKWFMLGVWELICCCQWVSFMCNCLLGCCDRDPWQRDSPFASFLDGDTINSSTGIYRDDDSVDYSQTRGESVILNEYVDSPMQPPFAHGSSPGDSFLQRLLKQKRSDFENGGYSSATMGSESTRVIRSAPDSGEISEDDKAVLSPLESQSHRAAFSSSDLRAAAVRKLSNDSDEPFETMTRQRSNPV
jgi:hypothetical protein